MSDDLAQACCLFRSSLHIYSESNWQWYPNHLLVSPTTSWLYLPRFSLRALHVRVRERGKIWKHDICFGNR